MHVTKQGSFLGMFSNPRISELGMMFDTAAMASAEKDLGRKNNEAVMSLSHSCVLICGSVVFTFAMVCSIIWEFYIFTLYHLILHTPEVRMKAKDYIAINVYWFGLAFLWNALHPIVLPALLLRYVPEALKNTYLGGMTFVGLVLAMLIQPIAGALSDSTRSHWGRRRPWMLTGTLFSLVFLV